MPEAIVLKQLKVHVVTGDPAEDPHGQGFSAIYAEVTVTDKSTIRQLNDAKQQKTPITLRCAMLDVTGWISKSVWGFWATKFILAIDDMCYRKPEAGKRERRYGSVL